MPKVANIEFSAATTSPLKLQSALALAMDELKAKIVEDIRTGRGASVVYKIVVSKDAL